MIDLGLPLAAFVILMGVFLFDATFTLLRRMVRRERWWHSHRSHLYQRAHASGLSQPLIVGSVIVIDVILALLASALVFLDVDALLAAAVATLLLAVTGMGIGRREARLRGRESAT